jgi:hypothetical protein
LVRMPGTPPPFYLVQPNNTVPAKLYTNMTLDYTQVSMYRVSASVLGGGSVYGVGGGVGGSMSMCFP